MAHRIRLSRIVLRNFKSIASCDVRLGNLTYLVQARDRKVLGPTALAPYNGGFTNTFSYKGFSFDEPGYCKLPVWQIFYG